MWFHHRSNDWRWSNSGEEKQFFCHHKDVLKTHQNWRWSDFLCTKVGVDCHKNDVKFPMDSNCGRQIGSLVTCINNITLRSTSRRETQQIRDIPCLVQCQPWTYLWFAGTTLCPGGDYHCSALQCSKGLVFFNHNDDLFLLILTAALWCTCTESTLKPQTGKGNNINQLHTMRCSV